MVSVVGTTSGAPASSAAFQITLPSYASGDRGILIVSGKPSTLSTPTIDQGWTLLVSTSNLGVGIQGADTGTVRVNIYAKDLDASETAPTVTPGTTAPNTWVWVCRTFRPDSGKTWLDALASMPRSLAADTNTASPQAANSSGMASSTAGDAVFVCMGNPSDSITAVASGTITATGLTGGTVEATSTNFVANSLGNDCSVFWMGWTGFTGTQSGQFASSMTGTGLTNHSGAVITMSVREQAGPATGTATGTLAYEGTATGARAPEATADGTLTYSGTATGQRTPKATATGSLAWVGTAVGVAPTPTAPAGGTAIGTLAWSGSATGARMPKATAAGTTAWVGTATGVRAPKATAAGVVAFVGTATGKREPVATASGTVAWVGSSSGLADRRGTAEGLLEWAGSALGQSSGLRDITVSATIAPNRLRATIAPDRFDAEVQGDTLAASVALARVAASIAPSRLTARIEET